MESNTNHINWPGSVVAHEGAPIGLVTEIRRNLSNGRRYAFVQPHDPASAERRLPIDELTLVEGV